MAGTCRSFGSSPSSYSNSSFSCTSWACISRTSPLRYARSINPLSVTLTVYHPVSMDYLFTLMRAMHFEQ
nr:MAG TPA: hypothetical protein [Caudoviricetes sp.]